MLRSTLRRLKLPMTGEVHNRWTVPIPDLRQTLELAYGTLVNGESGRG
jgi:hypothetical protein